MSAIEPFKPTKALALFNRPLAPITSAMLIGNQLREQYAGVTEVSLQHRESFVPTAIEVRNERLGKFLEADLAATCLSRARHQELEESVASKMVTALYRHLGMKAGDESMGMLEGSLAMFASDEIGRASGSWEPLNVSPATLALACLKLMNTQKFPTKPAEELVEYVRKADAVLLAFSYTEWERPYLSPQYRPVLTRMLELHNVHGDDSLESDWDDNPFRELVDRERAKLAIGQASPKRIAAARARTDSKRSSKPKLKKGGKQT
jgi:hypothetical protein